MVLFPAAPIPVVEVELPDIDVVALESADVVDVLLSLSTRANCPL